MRKQLLLAGLFCVSAIAFGQKKEIKKAEKALDAGNATEAVSYINEADSMIAGADND